MNMTPEELNEARWQLARLQEKAAERRRIEKETPEPRCPSCGHVSGFERLLWQENGIHLNGDHT